MIKTPEQELKIRTRRNFLALGAAAVAGVSGWNYLRGRPQTGELAGPFRGALELNEKVAGQALFGSGHRAPEFPAERGGDILANGDYGLDDEVDVPAWRLQLASRELTMRDIQSLEKVEQTTEFKCIEGWSAVVHWTGVRFSDFTRAFAPGSEKARYAALETPDKEYFVGIDMASALHPQTLLAYEMNGQPLTAEHGAPLRLVIPVKYGIKNIKRIGRIAYSDQRPRDYWAQEGYDYYAGL